MEKEIYNLTDRYQWHLHIPVINPLLFELLNMTCEQVEIEEPKIELKFIATMNSDFFKALEWLQENNFSFQMKTPGMRSFHFLYSMSFGSIQWKVENQILKAVLIFDAKRIKEMDNNNLINKKTSQIAISNVIVITE